MSSLILLSLYFFQSFTEIIIAQALQEALMEASTEISWQHPTLSSAVTWVQGKKTKS